MKSISLYPALQQYLEERSMEFDLIPKERQKLLSSISTHIENQLKNNHVFNGIIICTHNSRRSHFGQVWLAAAASFYGKDPLIKTYSGGTEATSVYPTVIKTLGQLGLKINYPSTETKNPLYEITWRRDMSHNPLFSKTYNDEENPESNFTAIMVCTDADEACPMVLGANMRFSLPYNDPKTFDGTKQELSEYKKTSNLIAREMLYIMSLVKD